MQWRRAIEPDQICQRRTALCFVLKINRITVNVFIFLIDPLSLSLSHVSLLCPGLAPSRSKAFDFFLSLSRCHYCVERKPARNFIALARKGAALVRTYVPGHVGTEPRPLCPLWLFRARERYHPLGTGVISTRPDGRQKCKREQAHPSRLARHRFLGTGNRVLPWHVSTVHSFSLFLLRARTAHRFYFFSSSSISSFFVDRDV